MEGQGKSCIEKIQRNRTSRVGQTYLEIRDGSVEFDTPIDEAVGAVDDAFLMEFAEGFDDGGGEVLC